MNVPFLDLRQQVVALREEFEQGFAEVLDNTAFAGGPVNIRFEEAFAAYCGTSEAIGVGSGTEALWLALLALDIGPGDEVITVPNTFVATVEAIHFTGATPVLVDVDPVSYNLDPAGLEAAWTPRTRAVIPVHLYGQPADMDPILAWAAEKSVSVIEDAAQAQGARYRDRPAGSMGQLGCFSFYPGKNLGAFGEAGAVVTSDAELAKRVRMLRDHGQSRKYYHDLIGWNGRMDGLQAAVLNVKLPRLDAANEARRQHAARYSQCLEGAAPQLILPRERADVRHVYHVYAVRCPERDRLLDAMRERGVACGIHYPVPVHLQKAYQYLGQGERSFPIAEAVSREELSLPMFPELTDEQIDYVCSSLLDALKVLGMTVEDRPADCSNQPTA